MSENTNNANNGDGGQVKNLDQNNANQNANANGANDGNNNSNDGKGEIMIPKSRFDEVNKGYQELKTWKEEQEAKAKEAEAKKLEEEGKYKELLEKEKAEKENLAKSLERQRKIDAVKTEAIKRGANNADVVVKLLDLDSIKLSEDGSVDNEAIVKSFDSLVESDAYLFGGSKPKNIGGEGGAPDGGSQTVKQFKRSQLADAKFYRENEKDIRKAMETGNIIDDVTPQGN